MNKELNYTKGEWHVVLKDEYGQDAISVSILTPKGQMLLSCNGIPAKGEMLANAKLCASAPLMYEALKYIIRELDKADIIKANSIFMEMPNRAIAKVEGK